jgi:hypothetical protein
MSAAWYYFSSGSGTAPPVIVARDIRQAIAYLLMADDDLTALVDDRIYFDHLPAPDANGDGIPEPIYPALSFSVISRQRDQNLGGHSGKKEARIQFDAWSDDESAAIECLKRIEAIFDGVGWQTVDDVTILWSRQSDDRDIAEATDDGSDAWTDRVSVDYVFKYRAHS